MNKYRLAIVGATGLVGSEFIKVLEQRDLSIESVKMLASYRSAGKKLFFNHQEYMVEETTPESFLQPYIPESFLQPPGIYG